MIADHDDGADRDEHEAFWDPCAGAGARAGDDAQYFGMQVLAQKITPMELIVMINNLFSTFDVELKRCHLFKMDTVCLKVACLIEVVEGWWSSGNAYARKV